MKKAISILLAIIMSAAIVHITVAKHYCGGKEVAAMLSLSGKTVSCGMAATEKKFPSTGTSLYADCCKDVVNLYGIGSNYLPSFQRIMVNGRILSPVFCLPADSYYHSIKSFKIANTDIWPPGVLISTNVDLSDICTFRI